MAETLLQALLNIQQKAPKVQADGFNPYTESHFMELKDVVREVTPMLNDEELLWQARPSIDAQGRPSLKYSLTHVPSKEALSDEMPLMLPKGTPQDQGSAITYARRYALVAALNLVADRDDDGSSATTAASLPDQAAPESEVSQPLTAEEQTDLRQVVADLAKELREFPEAWTATEQWAKEREIELDSPPADRLRAVERALQRKLARTRAEQAKGEAKSKP